MLVQRLVAAEAAGVAFSHDPRSGEAEVVIEAVAGLGDRLVDGTADPDRWVVDAAGPRAVVDSGVLDAVLARRLAATVRRVAQERGGPQDVEWAFAGGELHLLQARPITHLPVAPAIEVPPGRWLKDSAHCAGPMTPMGASILLPVYEAGAKQGICEDFGLPRRCCGCARSGARFTCRKSTSMASTGRGAPPPWWVLAIACRVVPMFRRRMADAAAASAKVEVYPRLWDDRWRAECLERIDQARAVDLGSLTDGALLTELRRVVDEVVLPHIRIHFQLFVPGSVGLFELQRVCAELLGWGLGQVLDLLGGLSTTTTAPAREPVAIARDLPAGVVEQGLDAVRRTPAGPRLDAWLARWGLGTIDLDPGSPQLAEREDLVLALLASHRAVEQVGDVARRREEAVAAARSAIADPPDRARFDRALAFAELVYPLREDNVPYTEAMPSGLVRRVLREVGGRLAARGALERAGDVAYLEVGELADALAGGETAETPRQRVRRRRAEAAWVLAHPGPAVHGPSPVDRPMCGRSRVPRAASSKPRCGSWPERWLRPSRRRARRSVASPVSAPHRGASRGRCAWSRPRPTLRACSRATCS